MPERACWRFKVRPASDGRKHLQEVGYPSALGMCVNGRFWNPSVRTGWARCAATLRTGHERNGRGQVAKALVGIGLAHTDSIHGEREHAYRYELSVRNFNAYPDALFAPAPSLPPCGLNTNSSRSWVSIYDRQGTYINGFCRLQPASELNAIGFADVAVSAFPTQVYIEIWDLETNTRYVSTKVQVPAP